MAITDKKTGPWGLDQVYNKINQGSIWEYSGLKEFYVWGMNSDGLLGQNQAEAQLTAKSSPTQIPGTTWKSLGSMYDSRHALGIKTDGTLWGWGFGNDGNIGVNNRTAYSSPVQVPGTTWAACQMIQYASIATKTDGTLWAWGYNGYGNLGHNNETRYSSPVQVGSDTIWPTDPDQLAGGSEGGMAIKTDGTLWVWGNNSQGRLGINDIAQRSSPTQLGSASDWSKVSSGTRYFNVAIKTDGTLWGWGQNKFGQLGLNQSGPGAPTPDNQNLSSPAQVPGTTWKIVSGSQQSVLATKTDGTLWAWGRNYNGMLGQNDEIMYSSPAQIPGTDWDRPLAMTSKSAAIKTDGTLWMWGAGGTGALGQNDRTDRSSPVQVPGTSWDSTAGRMAAWGEGNTWGLMKNI